MRISFKIKGLLTFLVLLVLFLNLNAQDSIPSYTISLLGKVAQNNPTPFWLVHGRYGKIDSDINEALLIADVNVPFFAGKKWKFELGAQVIGKSKLANSYLQEAYFNAQFGKLMLIVGKEELTFTQYSNDLGSGSYYLSNNARPIPRVGIGFYEYVDVPFTKGYVQVKGFLNQGVLDDDRGAKGTTNPLFHEKIAYIRTNKLIVNPHVGLNHSALYGGTRPGGKKIPIDYWAVFFGGGSKKVGEAFPGEGTNVAGGHLGLFDVGVNFDVKNIHVQTYYQKPFSDGSGFWQFFERNKDHIFGLVATISDGKLIEELVYENIYTLSQSGPGAIDPYVNGKVYYFGDIKDYDQFLFDNYGVVTQGTTEAEFSRFLERMENHGFKYGGRDNYNNNGLYYQGWSYNGLSVGTPLFLNENRVLKFAPEFDGSWDKYFVNNRVKAHHFGAKGSVSKSLRYLIKYSYTRNYGTYFGLNKGPYKWESADPFSTYEYYFQNKFAQHYLLLETNYQHTKINGLNINFSFTADFGEMYNSVGILCGVSYNGVFSLSKPKTNE